jgi:hypothetical protein
VSIFYDQRFRTRWFSGTPQEIFTCGRL